MRKLVTATLGVLLAAVAGCSSPSTTTEPAAPVGQVSSALGPGQVVTVPNANDYASCQLDYGPSAFKPPPAPPSWVVRLRRPWVTAASQEYGFTDPYMLPFRTPWIGTAPTGGTLPSGQPAGTGCLNPLPSPTNDCAYVPNVFNYEQELATNVPTIVPHQFLIFQLVNCQDIPKTNDKSCTTSSNAFFYNGTPANHNNGNDLTTGRDQTIADWQGAAYVHPTALNCVYVMEEDSSGNLVFSGYHSFVAQSHDPINYPN